MTFKTDTLRSLINDQRGIASQNRFSVILPSLSGTPKPGGGNATDPIPPREMNLLCTAARIPGKNFSLLDRQIGMEPIKVVNGYSSSDVSLTFYLTNDYSARKYFQEWSECIVSPSPPYSAGFHADYAKSVTVIQLDKGNLNVPDGEKVYEVELVKAYPTTITEVELNNQAQGAALELTVSFVFSNYLIK